MANRTENQGLDKWSVGFGISFLVASLFNALLIVAKESYAPLKDWMKALSGHHWISHGIFVIVLFIALGYALSRTDLDETIDAAKTAWMVIAGTVLGGLIIVGFFFKHLFE
jgi:formate hydrogenlyase subunit 3/multisubunit Na+/H+ antiporter MnhD subunit